jgi:hypothetical protein
MMDFMFFILDSISKSSFKKGVIYEPRVFKATCEMDSSTIG